MQGATPIDYFRGIKTARGANLRWRSLAKKHHPDAGGDPDVMAEVNRQYRETLTRLKMPPVREPNVHEEYVPPPREEVAEPEPQPRRPLLSDEEVQDVADTAATFVATAVRAGVKALTRKFARRE